MRGLLFLCLLGSAFAGFGMLPENLLKKYAHIKILSSCFGDEILEKYLDKFKAAAQECDKELSHDGQVVTHTHEHTHKDGTVHTHEHTHEKGQEDDHDHSHSETAKPVDGQVRIEYVPIPFHYPYNFGSGRKPFVRFPGLQFPVPERNKRHVEDNKGQNYVDRIIDKVESMECALRKLDYVDEEGQPKVEAMKAEMNELNISSTLKEDLHQAVDHCYDFAACLPSEKAKHPLVKKLGRTVAFIKCVQMKEIAACMRQDFIKHAHKKGLDGNDEKLFELLMTFSEAKEDPEYF